MVLGDFHIHTRYSDGRLNIRQTVDLYGRHGFKAIAITDHLCETHTTLGALARYLDRTLSRENFVEYIEEIHQEAERAKNLYDMTVLPGVEITKNSFSHDDSAHIVALGITAFIDPDQEIPLILRQIREQGGLSIAAHPVATGKWEAQTYHLWHQREFFRNQIDTWEIASGARIFPEVRDSGLPMIANSDLHHPLQMRSWKTLVDSENHPESILEAIRRQKVSFRFWNKTDGSSECLSRRPLET